VTLHDSAYNADRNIATGNPYKGLISALQEIADQRRTTATCGRLVALIVRSAEPPYVES
jgi:hypothetical protein